TSVGADQRILLSAIGFVALLAVKRASRFERLLQCNSSYNVVDWYTPVGADQRILLSAIGSAALIAVKRVSRF
ncbi:MAG: hypothetical protein VW258_04880, partial [Thalassolituus sp.]